MYEIKASIVQLNDQCARKARVDWKTDHGAGCPGIFGSRLVEFLFTVDSGEDKLLEFVALGFGHGESNWLWEDFDGRGIPAKKRARELQVDALEKDRDTGTTMTDNVSE